MKVEQSRLLFINSEVRDSTDGRAKIEIPSHPFQVYGDSKMALTLLSFEMRRKWYNINDTNSIFYWHSATANSFVEVSLAAGNYGSFEDSGSVKGLRGAIEDAVTASLANFNTTFTATATLTSVTYDENTRKLAIELGGGAIPADLKIVMFHCKPGTSTRPVVVREEGFYSDSYEILGGIPTTDSANLKAAFTKSTGNIFTSTLPASLNSLEAIYLRMNVQTSNYQTNGFGKFLPNTHAMTESDIFARIPLDRTCFDPVFENIIYTDNNDIFRFVLQRKTLDSVMLDITDSKGRSLSELDPSASYGLMNFKAVLRWDALSHDYAVPHGRVRAPDPTTNHRPLM